MDDPQLHTAVASSSSVICTDADATMDDKIYLLAKNVAYKFKNAIDTLVRQTINELAEIIYLNYKGNAFLPDALQALIRAAIMQLRISYLKTLADFDGMTAEVHLSVLMRHLTIDKESNEWKSALRYTRRKLPVNEDDVCLIIYKITADIMYNNLYSCKSIHRFILLFVKNSHTNKREPTTTFYPRKKKTKRIPISQLFLKSSLRLLLPKVPAQV